MCTVYATDLQTAHQTHRISSRLLIMCIRKVTGGIKAQGCNVSSEDVWRDAAVERGEWGRGVTMHGVGEGGGRQ